MSKFATKKALSSKTKFVTGIISFKDWELYWLPLDELKQWFDAFADQYAFIPHFADYDENGELKTLHVHFVADLKKSTRLRTTLNSIADVCGVCTLAVSIEQYTDFDGCVQYLVHRNDEDKTQYCAYLITSNMAWKDLLATINADAFVLDASKLIAIVRESPCKSAILQSIGLFYFHRYRGVINDLWIEMHGGYDKSPRINYADNTKTA